MSRIEIAVDLRFKIKHVTFDEVVNSPRGDVLSADKKKLFFTSQV